MNKRAFGSGSRSMSEIGLGTWQIGGNWGDVTEAAAEAILSAAVDQDITFFDTADVYGGGLSERRIGRFLKQCETDVFVATKMGRDGDPGGSENHTPDAMRRHTEASLERLGVSTLELTQLHCIPTEVLRAGHVFDPCVNSKRRA